MGNKPLKSNTDTINNYPTQVLKHQGNDSPKSAITKRPRHSPLIKKF